MNGTENQKFKHPSSCKTPFPQSPPRECTIGAPSQRRRTFPPAAWAFIDRPEGRAFSFLPLSLVAKAAAAGSLSFFAVASPPLSLRRSRLRRHLPKVLRRGQSTFRIEILHQLQVTSPTVKMLQFKGGDDENMVSAKSEMNDVVALSQKTLSRRLWPSLGAKRTGNHVLTP